MASTTGSYVGNGATDRTISLPFTPKLVYVSSEGELVSFFSNLNVGTYGMKITSGATLSQTAVNATRPALTTNGFIVSGNVAKNTNVNTKTYYYFASG